MRNTPPYIYFMLVLTGVYLTFEIPFSVYLVDVLGGLPSSDDIAEIEFSGRILTAAAIAIAFVGALVFPRYPDRFFKALSVALVSGSVVGVSSFYALDIFASNLSKFTTPEVKKEAYVSAVPRLTLHESAAFGDVADTPEFSAMRSLSASFTSSDDLIRVSGRGYDALSERYSEVILGGLSEFKQQTLSAYEEFLVQAYSGYLEASRVAKEKLAEGPRKASSEYHRMAGELKSETQKWELRWGKISDNPPPIALPVPEHGYKFPPRGSAYEAEAIRRVKAKLPVSDRWHPRDKQGFVSAYLRKYNEEVLRRASGRFAGRIGRYGDAARFPDLLPLDLTFAQFSRIKLLQERFRIPLTEKLHVSVPHEQWIIEPGMSDEAFKRAAYDPVRDFMNRSRMRAKQAPLIEYNYGGQMISEYLQSAWIPVMAIILSVAGAALHIFKFSGYLWSAVVGSGRFGKPLFATSVLCGSFALMALPGNAITGKVEFQELKARAPVMAAFSEGLISIQPGFQMVGNALAINPGWQLVRTELPDRRNPLGSISVASEIADPGFSLTTPGVPIRKPGSIPVPPVRPAGHNALKIASR